MGRVEIVGAGLAGFTAAINLAREGREVVIYEQEKKIGGHPAARPDPAGSPFGLPRLTEYIGFDIEPALRHIKQSSQVMWGKHYSSRPRPNLPVYLVERGSRKSSMDTFLYEKAKEAGVEVQFGQVFKTRKDFMDLPPDSIIATGLHRLPYDILGVPYKVSNAFFARGKVDHDTSNVTIYMGDYTRDYAFSSTINGVSYAMLYQREKPLTHSQLDKFAAEVERFDGYDLSPWKEVDIGVVPFKSYDTPRLFYSDKIITGTLSGSIEPVMGFGMLGAFISGKIAAIAVTDRGRAYKEFRRLNTLYGPQLFMKTLMNLYPTFVRRVLYRLNTVIYDRLPDSALDKSYVFVPGYGRMG